MIVCIPTKGRPNTKTHLLYEKSKDVKVYHFIEPQDYEKYNVDNKIDIGTRLLQQVAGGPPDPGKMTTQQQTMVQHMFIYIF